jgi:hypothetical protein
LQLSKQNKDHAQKEFDLAIDPNDNDGDDGSMRKFWKQSRKSQIKFEG